MRISDWSSDVCSSDLPPGADPADPRFLDHRNQRFLDHLAGLKEARKIGPSTQLGDFRSEEHTSELQSLMRISYAVFCLKKKKKTTRQPTTQSHVTTS